MSLIITPWTRQPQHALPIAENWKQRGHVLSYVAGVGLSDGYTFSSNNAGLTAGKHGRALAVDGPTAGIASIADNDALDVIGHFSCIVALKVRALKLSAQDFLGKSSSDSQWYNMPYSMSIGNNGRLILGRAGAACRTWYASSELLAAGDTAILAFIAENTSIAGCSTSTMRFWRDGVKLTSNNEYTQNTGDFTSNANALKIGYTDNGYNNDVDVDIFGFHIFNRALTDSEAKFLTENMWQVFQDDTLDLWIPAAAGGSETVTPSAGALTLSGLAPTLSLTEHKTVTPSVGALTIAGLAPTLSVSGNKVVTPDVASLAITGLAPTLSLTANQWITSDVGALSITGNAPTVSTTANQWVTAGVGAITITGYAPTVNRTEHQWIATGVGSMMLSGLAPTISVSAEGVVQPGFGALTLTGYAPTVQRTEHHWVTTGLGALTFTGNAPTLDSGIKAGLGALTLTGLAPTISVSDLKIVTPSIGALTITGYAPVVFSPITITPTAAELTITGYAPTLTSAIILPGIAELELTGYAPTLAVNGWFDVTAATDTWIDVSAASDTWTNI